MISGKTVVVLSTADWDAPLWTNKQHVASRLAGANRVLYVESLGMRAPTLSVKDLKRLGRRLARAAGVPSARPRPPGLEVLSPAVIPFWGSRLARAYNVPVFSSWLDRQLARRGVASYVLWTYTPLASLILDRLKRRPDKVVYHCVDDLTAFPRIPQAVTRAAEDELFHRADATFFTSRLLCDKKGPLCRRAVFVGNVADPPAELPRVAAEALEGLPRPIVGFSGAIDSAKLDWRTLEKLASPSFPGSLLLVGPLAATEDPSRLEGVLKSPKARWLGGKSQAEASAWMAECDVLAVPYALNDYTRCVFPMKLFEYLHLGKPVVSAPLPEILPFADSVAIAEGPEAFARAVEVAWRTDGEDRRRARREVAGRHTWSALLETMSGCLAETAGAR